MNYDAAKIMVIFSNIFRANAFSGLDVSIHSFPLEYDSINFNRVHHVVGNPININFDMK